MRTPSTDLPRRLLSLLAPVVAALTIALLTGFSALCASASEVVDGDGELTLEQTVAVPAVPAQQKEYVKKLMLREAKALQKLGFKVETMRQGEVVIASVGADRLFAPNDTVLLPSASATLNHLLPYFRSVGRFKIALAMHSDDTGSDQYLYDLTEKRIVALYDFFDRYAAQTDALQGYPMADTQPLAPNNSRHRRADNRRLEIYLIPGNMLITEAKTKIK